MNRAYLDYNATAPCREEALAAMAHAARDVWGNAASAYREGRAAEAVVEQARDRIADALGALPLEIVFTSGGTESDDLAIEGVVGAARLDRRHVVTTGIEHSAVAKTCTALRSRGIDVSTVGCDVHGRMDARALTKAVRDDTVLLSLMQANNETGVLQPVEEVSSQVRPRGVLLHCDAVQAFGKVPVNVNALGVDLLSLSAHKIGGPKGIGLLYVRTGTPLEAVLRGGQQERGKRAGTLNTPAIAAFAVALILAVREQPSEHERLGALVRGLERELQRVIPDLKVNGDAHPKLPNTLNVSVPGVGGMEAMVALDLEGFSVSTGSACAVGAVEPSRALTAMGLPEERVKGAVRISLGRLTVEAEIERFVPAFAHIAQRLREETGHANPA